MECSRIFVSVTSIREKYKKSAKKLFRVRIHSHQNNLVYISLFPFHSQNECSWGMNAFIKLRYQSIDSANEVWEGSGMRVSQRVKVTSIFMIFLQYSYSLVPHQIRITEKIT